MWCIVFGQENILLKVFMNTFFVAIFSFLFFFLHCHSLRVEFWGKRQNKRNREMTSEVTGEWQESGRSFAYELVWVHRDLWPGWDKDCPDHFWCSQKNRDWPCNLVIVNIVFNVRIPQSCDYWRRQLLDLRWIDKNFNLKLNEENN